MKQSASYRAVFLDRDGVLIKSIIRGGKPFAATSRQEIEILDGVREACAELSRLGFLLVLVTNQPDVARKIVSRAFVDETNADIAKILDLDDVQVCCHDDSDKCDCRKPRPGMMTNAAEKLSISLSDSIVVGDRWRDIEAGHRAGCKTVLIDHGYDEVVKSAPDHVAESLFTAVQWIRNQV